MNAEDALKKARDSVLRLLKVRPRSEEEIRERLIKKNFNPAVIEETIQYFKKLRLIDDRAFTKGWISSRLLKPYGFYRIQYELQQKGIELKIIQEELKSASEEYSEEEIANELAARRLLRYQHPDPQKSKEKLQGFLARRGFSPKAITQTLKKL